VFARGRLHVQPHKAAAAGCSRKSSMSEGVQLFTNGQVGCQPTYTTSNPHLQNGAFVAQDILRASLRCGFPSKPRQLEQVGPLLHEGFQGS
jgi:hypothetical protein